MTATESPTARPSSTAEAAITSRAPSGAGATLGHDAALLDQSREHAYSAPASGPQAPGDQQVVAHPLAGSSAPRRGAAPSAGGAVPADGRGRLAAADQDRREEPRDPVHRSRLDHARRRARRRPPRRATGCPATPGRAAPAPIRSAGPPGSGTTSTPAASSAATRSGGASSAASTITGCSPGARGPGPSRAAGGPTSRTRPARAGARGPSTSRAVRRGSSASAVPSPTATASLVGPPAVHQGARGRAGDPAALARRRRDLAVEAGRELQGHVGQAGDRPGEEGGVQLGARAAVGAVRPPRPRCPRRAAPRAPGRGRARADRRSR